MIDSLRRGGEARLDEASQPQTAGGFTAQQANALRASLTELVRAKRVDVTAVDRFGADVYRHAEAGRRPGRADRRHAPGVGQWRAALGGAELTKRRTYQKR